MIAKPEREQIIALINREVVPAIGCTEPIAVALCVAKATETLGKRPERIKALLSANILTYRYRLRGINRKIRISIGSLKRQHS